MMCLNCLVGLHNLCLATCTCIHHNAQEMDLTVRDVDEFQKYKKRKATQLKRFREFQMTDAEVLYNLDHVVWLRFMTGRFPKRTRLLEDLWSQRRLDSKVNTKPCKFCHQVTLYGTARKAHGIGKCLKQMCEECGERIARLKSSDGFLLCEVCDRQFKKMHIPDTKIAAYAPIIQNSITYDRPAYIRPTITYEEAMTRHAQDYSMFGGEL